MKSILEKCATEDFVYLSELLNSYLSFTNDSRRRQLLAFSSDSPASRAELIELIDIQIRYYGSSDFAYFKRAVFSDGAGISATEVVEDVCNILKVKIKAGGSLESRLERLVNGAVEKELLSKSPEELSKAFKDLGIGAVKRERIIDSLKKNGRVAVLPILVKILGPKVTLGVIETIIVSMITQIVGREAAKHLMKELLKRNPWINVLGPIIWAISAGWMVLDLQGPAYRKTVPICLYLGVVALRDGKENEMDETAFSDF